MKRLEVYWAFRTVGSKRIMNNWSDLVSLRQWKRRNWWRQRFNLNWEERCQLPVHSWRWLINCRTDCFPACFSLYWRDLAPMFGWLILVHFLVRVLICVKDLRHTFIVDCQTQINDKRRLYFHISGHTDASVAYIVLNSLCSCHSCLSGHELRIQLNPKSDLFQ